MTNTEILQKILGLLYKLEMQKFTRLQRGFVTRVIRTFEKMAED